MPFCKILKKDKEMNVKISKAAESDLEKIWMYAF